MDIEWYAHTKIAQEMGEQWKHPFLENYFSANGDPINCVSFNHTGKQLASGDKEGELRIWNFKESVTRSYTFNEVAPIKNVRFSPDGSLVASAWRQFVTLRKPEMETTVRTISHGGWVLCVDISPDMGSLVSSSSDKTIKLFNIDGKFQHTFIDHKNWVRWVSFSPDGRWVLSASDDSTMKVCDVGTQWCLMTIPYSRGHCVFCAKFHPNGRSIVACGSDKSVHVWDIRAMPNPVYSFTEHSSTATCVDIHKGGDHVCSSSRDGTVKVYSLRENRILYTLHVQNSPLHSVQFSPQGDQLALADERGEIFIWRTNFK